jgi:hypothetical protein
MSLEGLSKTDGLPHHAFDPCTHGGMWVFDLLRVVVPNRMRVMINMTTIGPPPVCVKACDAQRLQSRLAFQEDVILSCPKDISSAMSCVVITRMPPPQHGEEQWPGAVAQ